MDVLLLLLILPVYIESKSLLLESLSLRQKHAMFANEHTSTKRICLARVVIVAEHVFSTSMAVREVSIVTRRIHISLTFVTDKTMPTKTL